MPRTAWIVFAATLLLVAAHLTWAHGVLPDPVASHFGAGGVADNWQSRTGFVVTFGATVAFCAVTFLGIGLWLPRMPTSLVNLPNREHWLAPERRDETLAHITAQLLYLGAATNLFLLAMAHLTVQANREVEGTPTLSDAFWVIFGAYMLGVGVWTVRLLVRYSRDPK
jgi:hypothetical protein